MLGHARWRADDLVTSSAQLGARSRGWARVALQSSQRDVGRASVGRCVDRLVKTEDQVFAFHGVPTFHAV